MNFAVENEPQTSTNESRERFCDRASHSAANYYALQFDSIVLLGDGRRDSMFIRVGDIVRIEACGNNMVICACGKTITTRGSLRRYIQRLPKQFFQLRRDCIVNLVCVAKVNALGKQFQIRMSDGKEIMASRMHSRLLRKRLSI